MYITYYRFPNMSMKLYNRNPLKKASTNCINKTDSVVTVFPFPFLFLPIWNVDVLAGLLQGYCYTDKHIHVQKQKLKPKSIP